LCEGCAFEPTALDAFNKWGNNNGASCHISHDVVEVIEALGYTVLEEGWGMHNPYVIKKISNGLQIVYPMKGYQIGGYDIRYPLSVLPPDIIEALMEAEVALPDGMSWEQVLESNIFHTLEFDGDDEEKEDGDDEGFFEDCFKCGTPLRDGSYCLGLNAVFCDSCSPTSNCNHDDCPLCAGSDN